MRRERASPVSAQRPRSRILKVGSRALGSPRLRRERGDSPAPQHSLSENHDSCYQWWAGNLATWRTANWSGRPSGKAPASRRQGGQRANSGSFDGKPLISFKTAKEKVWKSLEKAWKKLGNPWKSLETLGIPWKTLRAGRRRVGRFHFAGRAPNLRGGAPRPRGSAEAPAPRPCAGRAHSPDKAREVGEGRTARQPGQVRKEAAPTSQGGSLSNLLLCPTSYRR